LFGGLLRSTVRSDSARPSATIEPFNILQLDVARADVATLEAALQNFCAPEDLLGFRARPGGTEVAATKSVRLDRFPKVLIVQLKRFTFDPRTGSLTKLLKHVACPTRLTVGRGVVAPSRPPAKYRLVATLTHRGAELESGHYTADTRLPDGRWLRFDDDAVAPVPESKVLDGEAYLLFYLQD